jgi:hypothetical protein
MEIEDTPFRKEITTVYALRDFDTLGTLPGFVILEKRNYLADKKEGYCCVNWVFNRDKTSIHSWVRNLQLMKTPEGFIEVVNPIDGDIVNYFVKQVTPLGKAWAEKPTHVGIYKGNNRVASKFGAGYVYEHDISSILYTRGDNVKFFRKR